jgi:hypothetical protein
MDPRAGLDDLEKRKFLTLSGLELRALRHPARSQSLYRLHYPGSFWEIMAELKVVTMITNQMSTMLLSLDISRPRPVRAVYFICFVEQYNHRST